MAPSMKVSILGGGPAGLATGFYARQAGLDFEIYEARPNVGGNCVTLASGHFRFDSGAHRFHGKIPEVTSTIRNLLGDDLRRIRVPSQIWHQGQFFDFPIAPLDLLKTLGPANFLHAGLSLLRGRCRGKKEDETFFDFALRTYGRDIASRFLLNYSQKLWGAPCEQLSTSICGSRLAGLGLRSLLVEAIRGSQQNTRHLDGSFYYPRLGYGRIVERLAEVCGADRIRTGTRITCLRHAAGRIASIEIEGRSPVAIDEVVSTLPLGLTLQLLDPPAPAELLEKSRQLRYRNVVLVALFLAKERITANGSVYFPDPAVPFTRVYEPKNRCIEMAPPGHTSLVAEIPCQSHDPVWTAADDVLLRLVADEYERIGWITSRDIVGAATHRMPLSYPILEVGYERRVQPIIDYLEGFENLRLCGRNGCFVYSHLHDMLDHGQRLVGQIRRTTDRRQATVPAPHRGAA